MEGDGSATGAAVTNAANPAGAGAANAAAGAGAGAAGNENAPSWRESIPEEYRENPALKDISDLGGLVKGYVHSQKLIGAIGNDPNRVVRIPGEDAEADEIAAFYNKLGRPEKLEDYKIEWDKENNPAKIQDKFVDEFKGWAHEAGLSSKQAQMLMDKYGGWASGVMEKSQQGSDEFRSESERLLRKEHGTQYETVTKMAANAALKLGGEDFVNLLDDTGLGNDPRMVNVFAKIGEMLSEDDRGAGGGSGSFGMTPAQAKAELAELTMDPNFTKALMDPEHMGHKEAIARRSRLYSAAYPQE